ncbi:MAG: acyl-CoA synthetase FdrA [Desulfurococcales archaeon]|nr:acyl-CoA synthetase FdrA [Desulfurococcales archaeon]
MIVRNIVKRNYYRDSVQLLHISEELKKLDGVINAAIVMGTELNKDLLKKEGLLTSEGAGATDSDMIIAVAASNEDALRRALEKAEELIKGGGPTGEEYYYSLELALKSVPEANLIAVSVPGEYAKQVVMEGLKRGLHAFVFSDHVPVEDEVEMKTYAYNKGLLVMGPGAGTALINGVALGFGNAVPRGPVGLVAAAGTGLQEVSVLVARIGLGVSQGIGVGGNDVKKPVNGLMTIQALQALDRDEETEVIGIVSKPPHPEVQDKIIGFVEERIKKPVVACFIGGKPFKSSKAVFSPTLHSAALNLARVYDEKLYREARRRISITPRELLGIAERERSKLVEGQRYIRGLYTGGTLTYEAMILLQELVGPVYSNAPLREEYRLEDSNVSVKHTLIDMGEEEFTRGRPHPMIDPTLRNKRIIQEAGDPETAVILLDFVLGYGAHPDPVGAHVEAIKEAYRIAENSGRHLIFIAHVAGVDGDPQGYTNQVEKLRDLGVIVMPTNALASLLASTIISDKVDEDTISTFYERYLGEEV